MKFYINFKNLCWYFLCRKYFIKKAYDNYSEEKEEEGEEDGGLLFI